MDGRDRLQLLPGTKKRLGLKVRGENRFLYIGSAILGAVLVLSFAFGRYETSLRGQTDQLNDQLVALEQKRNKGDEKGLVILKDRLALASKLLDDHVYWTRAVNTIESLIQSEVQFESFSGSIHDGTINIKAKTASYIILARQIASFLTGPGIQDVVIGQIQPLSNGLIEFELQIKFNKKDFILYKK